MSNRERASLGWQSARTAKVFYVIFVEEDIISPRNPANLENDDDGTVGCISWSRIPPPHTVNALKRAICRAEQVADPANYEIYKTLVDVEALDEEQKVILVSAQYPGVDPNEPVVIVNKKYTAGDIRGSPSRTFGITPSRRPAAPSLGHSVDTGCTVVNGQEIRSPIHEFVEHTGPANAVTFSPDGSLIASASEDKTIRIIELNSATSISTLQGHTESVVSVVFSPDGTRLASGSSSGKACIWETASGTCLQTLQGSNYPLVCIAFSPDGLQLASSSSGSQITLWDAESWVYLTPVNYSYYGGFEWNHPGMTYRTYCITFSPSGLHLAAASGSTLQVWEVASMSFSATLSGHTGRIYSVAWSPDGSLLASASADGTMRIWNSGNGYLLATLQDRSRALRSIAFSLDGTQVVSAEELVTTWDIASGAVLSSIYLQGHPSTVKCVVFSPDRWTLASCSSDKTVRVWSIA